MSAIFDIGVVISVSRHIIDKTLLSLIMIAAEIVHLRQLKIDVMKEKGCAESEIQFNLVLFDKWFDFWKESIILELVTTLPESVKNELKFHNWETASKYVETIIKQKRI
jgi:hypothetical protein